MGEEAEQPETPRTPFSGPALRIEVLSVSATPAESAAWKRVHHASITARLKIEGQPERVERTSTSAPVGNANTGLSVAVNETLRFPWPGSADGREPAKGALVVSLRRGVASRGFAPVALSEPVPIAEILQLALCTVRAEGLFTAWLTGKHSEGPAGKVLLRLSAEGLVPFVDPEEEKAAVKIQAIVRGRLTRARLSQSRPAESVASSEALTDDEDDLGAAVDEAVEAAMPDEEEEPAPAPAPAPAVDDEDSYSWLEDYERHEFRRWLLRLTLKVLAVGAAAGAARYAWLAVAKKEEEEPKATTKGGKKAAKAKGGKKVAAVTKLAAKKKKI